MPMLMTCSMRLPETPFHSPERTRSANAYMRSRTSWTSATVSWPSTTNLPIWSLGRRRTVCRTARSSVVLMCSPLNMASRRSSTFTARARSHSSLTVSSVTRSFERSKCKSLMSNESFSTRLSSAAKASLRLKWSATSLSWWALRASHSGVLVASTGAGMFDICPPWTMAAAVRAGPPSHTRLKRTANEWLRERLGPQAPERRGGGASRARPGAGAA